MTESERIQDQIRRAVEGEAWHGPAVNEILAGVSAKQAAAKPIRGAHSIWEILLHMNTWQDLACGAMEGRTMPTPSPAIDWPGVRDTGEHAWRAARDAFATCHLRLLILIARQPDSRLGERVPGREYSFYFLLHGITQHHLYHAGQMALLKKALV